MKNRKCPSHKACLDYDNGNCGNCVFGETVIKLYKRIDRLKKQKETLTIQRNAWALAAAAVKADTVRKMHERLKANKVCRDGLSFKVVDFDTIYKEFDPLWMDQDGK